MKACRVEFEFKMRNVCSWNGKWSGENQRYVKTIRVSSEKCKELNITIDNTQSWHHRWDDGWSANVRARILKPRERAKNTSFCGYEWMIENILVYNSTTTTIPDQE